jgi:DNA polymerase-3 subunit alpha
MAAGLHTEYAKRKHGLSRVTYPHDDLTEILETTYGILCYQEQVLQIAQKIAGFTLGQADMLRRAIGKKKQKEMDAQKAAFLAGTVAQGYEAKLGKDLWDLIEGFADYAFNKSHSAGYGLVTYQTAWLKANYPVEYMAALLTSVKNNKDRLPLYLNSCRTMGLTVLPPDVNASELDFAPVPGQPTQIRFGLSAVRNVGEQVVQSIIGTRTSQGAYRDFADFARKVDATCLNRRTVESLIKAGAFESLGHPRKGLLAVFELMCEQALATKRAESEGQFSLFGEMGGPVADAFEAVAVPDVEFDKREKLAAEREMLGLYVSDHPLLGLERLLDELSSGSIPRVLDGGSQGTVTVAGILTGMAKKFTRKGEPYVAGTLEDLQGAIDVIFFPAVYAAAGELLVEDAILCVKGRLDEGETPKLIASEVSQPDVSEATGAPLELVLAPQQCTPEVVGRLKDVLSEHRGVVGVHLRLLSSTGTPTRLRLDDEFAVARSPGLYAELKMLLGADAVV